MASSSLPFSLLSKGVGQLSKNGHERLDVYLEPEDYYNLQSKYQRYQIAELRRRAAQSEAAGRADNHHNIIPLHKTFLTRKGALLLFSEELAKKTLEEEHRQREKRKYAIEEEAEEEAEVVEESEETGLVADSLKTCNDLSWAILSYGRKPEYRKKGDELYLRFVHEPKGVFSERRIRPGFSPKRYISTWSKYWDEGMLQKLRSGGLISDKTLYRQNPLLPHLYKYATYNLSSVPPPYRVTKSMLLAPGNVPSYEFYRVKAPPQPSSNMSDELSSLPPSLQHQDDSLPANKIQAVKYHESGEIQEVTYADLKPQEKQEILAELLIAAHEHQQHIRETLQHVISTHRPRGGSEHAGSSSAASELMADMHRAILSLVESPVRQQMKERQRLLQEQQAKVEEERRQQELKEEKREKRRQERKAKKAAEKEAAKKAAEDAKREARERKKKKAEEMKAQAEDARLAAIKEKEKRAILEAAVETTVPNPKEQEKIEKEERRKKRREERELRRKTREEKKIFQEENIKKDSKEAGITERSALPQERPPSRDEPRPPVDEDGKHHQRHRRHRHRKNQEEGKEEGKERRQVDEHGERAALDEHDVVHKKIRSRSNDGATHSKYIVMSQQDAEDGLIIEQSVTGSPSMADKQSSRGGYVLNKHKSTSYHQQQLEDGREKLHRRDARLLPTQVPTNTPLVDMRVLTQQRSIEGDDVIDKRHKVIRHKSNSSSKSVVGVSDGPPVGSLLWGEPLGTRGPRSTASSHSSGPKQVVFTPELPVDEASSQTGSFYGGRMPITSNLVKQTLSDKVSITSSYKKVSERRGARSGGSTKATPTPIKTSVTSEGKVSDLVVPSIGIEPATPLHPTKQKSISPDLASSLHSHSIPGVQYLSPSGSVTGSKHGGGATSGGYKQSLKGQGSEEDSHRSGEDRDLQEDKFSDSEKQPLEGDGSENDESDHSDDASNSSHSTEHKSIKHEVASKSSQTVRSKSKHAASLLSDESSSIRPRFNIDGEPPYYGLKGAKGPGSQSSSSFIKSTSTKKSRRSRGNLPSAMRSGESATASIKMPDGEVISVGGSLTRSGDTEVTNESVSDKSKELSVKSQVASTQRESEESSLLKSVLKSSVHEEEMKPRPVAMERKVSFKESEQALSTTSEEEEEEKEMLTTGVSESDYDVTADEDEDSSEEIASNKTATSSGDTRPISSRSEKLTAHAQKIAAIVVKKQRPYSGLDDDAKVAAALWNKNIEEEEDSSEVEQSKSEVPTSVVSQSETLEEDEEESSSDEEDKKRKDRLQKIISNKEKEIKPTVPAATTPLKRAPSISGSVSSIQSSVSSVQGTFVSEMQRKASDLGIETNDLEFEADVVDKLQKSDITPDEVEVVHNKEAGRHIVRSRRSSTTVSSVLTPSSNEVEKESEVDSSSHPSSHPSVPKQKLVVDVVLPDKHSSATPSRASSIATSVTSQSPTSMLSPRSNASQRRKSSIPVEKSDVKLDYDVTTYEGKLGDPKPEEPTIQSGRPHIEPEKIKHVEPTAKETKLPPPSKDAAAPSHSKQTANKPKVAAADSVKSSHSSISGGNKKAIKAHAPTKGPLRKGQSKVEKTRGKSIIESQENTIVTSEVVNEAGELSKVMEGTNEGAQKAESRKKKTQMTKKPASISPEKETQRSTPEKTVAKTPETPFRAGQPKEIKQMEEVSIRKSPDDTGKQESIASVSRSKKGEKPKKSKKSKDPVTQVEVDSPKLLAKKKENTDVREVTPVADDVNKSKMLAGKELDTHSVEEEEEEFEEYVPPESPEDDYEFVRAEDTPEVEEEVVPEPEPEPEPVINLDDVKSQTSEVTGLTEATEASSQAAAQAAEDEAEREAKMAAKQERELKRAAAAERRRQEVERKRKEKEEQILKEKEEQERQEQMKEELEAERRRRANEIRLRKEEAEKAKERERQEEELRQKRLLQQQEREKKQQEEYKKKVEELQKKKREEEERKRIQAQQEAEEAAQRKREEEAMLAEMEESEREIYAQRKKEEEEERKRKEEERRKREDEEAKIAMEQARIQAIIKTKQQAALEEKLKFVREFFTEVNGMEQTQNVNRSFTFSYFELMEMLGLDIVID